MCLTKLQAPIRVIINNFHCYIESYYQLYHHKFLFRLINVTMSLKLVIGVLASSIVPLITYIVSTIVAHVQLNKLLKPEPNDEDYTHNYK